MLALTAAVFMVTIIVAYFADGRRIGALVWVTSGLSLTVAGHWSLAGNTLSVELGASLFLCLFVWGYWTGRFRLVGGTESTTTDRQSPSRRHIHTPGRGTGIIVLVVLVFTILHFALGGIPIFSSNVEVQRFAFADSGAFGVPSRMYLFGVPIATIVASAQATRGIIDPRIARWAWTIMVVSRLLGGFKSGLLDVMGIGIICLPFSGSSRVRRVLNLKALALVAVVVLAAAVMATAYRSLGLSEPADVGEYLLERSTVGAALGGAIAHGRPLTPPKHGTYLEDETRYFAGKYFSMGSTDNLYPLDVVVAAAQFREPVGQRAFGAPVTLGAGSGIAVDIGWPATVGAAALLGFVLARACRTLYRSTALEPLLLAGTLVVALNLAVKNGGLVYLVFNCTAVYVFLLMVGRASGVIPRGTRRRLVGR